MTKFRPLETFWKSHAALPPSVKERARRAFRLFQEGVDNPPFHPSLRIRKMVGHDNIWEVISRYSMCLLSILRPTRKPKKPAMFFAT